MTNTTRPAFPEWQPIETAPKDGTYILCAGKDMYGDKDIDGPKWRINKVFWSEGSGTKYDKAGWVGGLSTHFPLTHWMPLPPNPELLEVKS